MVGRYGRAVSLVLAIALVLGAVWTWEQANSPQLVVGSKKYRLEIADTEQERLVGLAGRASLAKNSGMLFKFERIGVHCFWMKDMHFPLDMVWLDNGKRIVHIQQNAQPNSFPNTFCPENAITYVIELPAGTVNEAKMAVGDTVTVSHLQ